MPLLLLLPPETETPRKFEEEKLHCTLTRNLLKVKDSVIHLVTYLLLKNCFFLLLNIVFSAILFF
jgi:hypothetical protein